MGCGCKTNQQISYLQAKYGDNQPKSKTTKIKEMFLGNTRNVLLMIFLIVPIIVLVVPVFCVILIIKYIFSKRKKTIDINKTFKIKE